jgi:tRNA A22 N-methylase
MSIRNYLTTDLRLTIDRAESDFTIENDLYVGNNIVNTKLLQRIESIENEINTIKSTLSTISSSSDLTEIKQIISDILEVLNPQ